MEESIRGDYGLVKAWKADEHGNLVFRRSARNFNPLMARAARVSVAEVEEIVPAGALDPDLIHLPGIYVDQLVLGERYEKRIERLTLAEGAANGGEQEGRRERIVRRAAQEFRDGMYGKEQRGVGRISPASEPGDWDANAGEQLHPEGNDSASAQREWDPGFGAVPSGRGR